MRRLGDSMGKSLCISSLLTAFVLVPGMVGAQTFKGVASPGAGVSAKALPVLPLTKARRGTSLTVRSTPMTDREGNPIGNRQQILVSAPPRGMNLTKKLLAPKFTDAFKLTPDITPFDPRGGGAENFLGCTGTAEVTVLANEITFGAGGPQVPTRVKYQIGENPPVTLFNGENASQHIAIPEQITLQPGEEIYLWGHSAYPDFNDPYQLDIEKSSADPQMAAILSNGEMLVEMMSLKGAATIPFGMQQSLEAILGGAGMMNNGMIQLDEDEMIILFELGATNSSSPAFDFNDLVLHVRTQCPNNTEVVLRDSIGPDNAMTHRGFVFPTSSAGSGFQFTPISLNVSAAIQLRRLDLVIAREGDDPVNWSTFDYEVRIWSSTAQMLSNPRTGDVLDCWLQHPSNVGSNASALPVFGEAVNSAIGTVASHLAEFDLSACPNVILQPGPNYQIAVQPHKVSGNGSDGILGIVDSSHMPSIGSEWLHYNSLPPPEYRILMQAIVPLVNGRVPMRVIGIQP